MSRLNEPVVSAWNAVAGVNHELMIGNITPLEAMRMPPVENWPLSVHDGVLVELTTAAIFGLQRAANTHGVTVRDSKSLGGKCLQVIGELSADSLFIVNVWGDDRLDDLNMADGNESVNMAYRGPLLVAQLALGGGIRDVFIPFSVPSLKSQSDGNMAHLLTRIRRLSING